MVAESRKQRTGAGALTIPRMPPPTWQTYYPPAELADLIARAKREDFGALGADATGELLIEADRQGQAVLSARKTGVLAGGALLPAIAAAFDPALCLETLLPEGAPLTQGAVIATVSGPLRAMLAFERTALNILGHLCGIASLTQLYVRETSGTNAKIYDTRKTLPGLRGLQKYAVACGGGHTHRMGLFDAVLVKDNHIAHLQTAELTTFLARTAGQARARFPHLKFVMIEADTLAQLDAVLRAPGIDLVLLDNMENATLAQAVALRNQLAPSVQLEASGGVNLHSVGAIARSGVDRISVGALTHSAANLDIGLDIGA